jgi:hypothetical protein
MKLLHQDTSQIIIKFRFSIEIKVEFSNTKKKLLISHHF